MRIALCDNCNLPSREMLRPVPTVKPGETPSVGSQEVCEVCYALVQSGDPAFEQRHEDRPRVVRLP